LRATTPDLHLAHILPAKVAVAGPGAVSSCFDDDWVNRLYPMELAKKKSEWFFYQAKY
jgi:hypothetical protein